MAKSPELVCVLLNEREILRADVFPVNPKDHDRSSLSYMYGVSYYDQTLIRLTNHELRTVLSDRMLLKQREYQEYKDDPDLNDVNAENLVREANQIGEVIFWLEEINDGE